MSHDAIVIGAGVNGLAAAAALGAEGQRVLVVEARDAIGGLHARREFHPGYHTAGILHDASGVPQRLAAHLGLERHGLRRRDAVAPILAVEPDGPGLLLHRDAELASAELANRAGSATEQYAAFRAFLARIGDFVGRILDEPPPDIAASGLVGAWPLLAKGWALRRLGKRTMLDLLRLAPMSVADWLREWFEDDLLMATLAGPALFGTWSGPRSAGTTATLLMRECSRAPDVEGGGPALVAALAAVCDSQRVETRTGAPVARIVVEQGVVRGVDLASGERIDAPAVFSAVDPAKTLLDFVGPRALPGTLGQDIAHWRARGTTAALSLALAGPLELASRAGESHGAVWIGESFMTLERAYDAVKYREMSEQPTLDLRVHSGSDFAPEGHSVVTALVHHAPANLRGGWTEEARDELIQRCLARLETYCPDLRDRIVGHELLTPTDLEKMFGTTGGHLCHGEHALDQLFWMRPHPRCARYDTPIPGLHLCGSGSHPGGGVTGGPGLAAAMAFA